MAEFTLLKLEFPDASFTANAPFSGSDEAEVDVESDDGEDDGGPGLLPLLAGLAFLVVLALAVRKLRGGSDGDLVEPSDEEPVTAVAE